MRTLLAVLACAIFGAAQAQSYPSLAPRPSVARLNTELTRILNAAEMKERWAKVVEDCGAKFG